jgi:hypothetical protein
MVRDFIRQTTFKSPQAWAPLSKLWHAFREQLPDSERPKWTRSRFVAEVGRYFETAQDSANQVVIVGRSLQPCKQWLVKDGRLTKAVA